MKKKINNKEVVKGLIDMKKNMVEKIEECENEVVQRVLTDLLQREPNEFDYKRCIRAFKKNVTDRYNMIYEGVDLGIILIKLENNECIVSFEPSDKYKLN